MSHPYSPNSIQLKGYIENDMDLLMILGIFFGGLVVLLAPFYLLGIFPSFSLSCSPSAALCYLILSPLFFIFPYFKKKKKKKKKTAASKKLSFLEKLTVIWFASCFLIHFFLEGYFSVYNQEFHAHQSFFAQVCMFFFFFFFVCLFICILSLPCIK